MADTGGDWRATAWLQELALSVREASATVDPAELSGALADALADAEPNCFVWVGGVDREADAVRVHATSSTADPDLSISTPDDQRPDPTRRARDEGVVLVHSSLAGNPEYRALDDQFNLPGAQAGLSIPVDVPGFDSTVLHLYTTRAVPEESAREAGRTLGLLVANSYRMAAGEADLARERRRLEKVRRTLSHDFGNPLNLASGRLELAAEDQESPHLSHAQAGLDRIETLVSTCVSFVEAGQPVDRRERRSVATLASECWERLPTGGRTLETAAVSVEAEPERLRLLLTSLLENAVGHTGPSVTVSVGPREDGRGFYVADTGPGIPADERAYVFDRGYTTDTDREGQGLALAREIARAHGWQLALTDASGGARFDTVTDRW